MTAKTDLPWGMHAALLLLASASVAQANEPLTGRAAYGDWHDDAPGVVRHITPDAMPAPYLTTSAHRGPSVVQRPAGAALHVPPGFEVEQFAAGLEQPRTLRVAPGGDVFVAESAAGRLRILRTAVGTSRPQTTVFADGLTYPFGIAFWPPGPEPRFVYVAETDRVIRFPYRAGDLRPRGKPDIVVPRLPSGGHATRDLVFSRDGRTMFVSVGSASNMGTSGEEERADVLAFDADGGNRRIFATGSAQLHGAGDRARDRRAVVRGERARWTGRRPAAGLCDLGAGGRILRLALVLYRRS